MYNLQFTMYNGVNWGLIIGAFRCSRWYAVVGALAEAPIYTNGLPIYDLRCTMGLIENWELAALAWCAEAGLFCTRITLIDIMYNLRFTMYNGVNWELRISWRWAWCAEAGLFCTRITRITRIDIMYNLRCTMYNGGVIGNWEWRVKGEWSPQCGA